MEYIVDLQGFQMPINQFVVKEIAVMDIKSDHHVVHLFEPPCVWSSLPAKYKCTNTWLTRNYHNLYWEDGYFPYKILKDAVKSMLRNASCIYVKGLEKKRFLEKLLHNKYYVIDVNDANCPSLKKLSENNFMKCPNHFDENANFQCALRNVQMLKTWICEHSVDE